MPASTPIGRSSVSWSAFVYFEKKALPQLQSVTVGYLPPMIDQSLLDHVRFVQDRPGGLDGGQVSNRSLTVAGSFFYFYFIYSL